MSPKIRQEIFKTNKVIVIYVKGWFYPSPWPYWIVKFFGPGRVKLCLDEMEAVIETVVRRPNIFKWYKWETCSFDSRMGSHF